MSFPFCLDVEVASPAHFIKWSQRPNLILEAVMDFLKEFMDFLKDSKDFTEILKDCLNRFPQAFHRSP